MHPWPKITEDEVIKVGWRTLVKKTFRTPDGQEAEFTTNDNVGEVACAVIALTKDNQVVVAEQFRPGPEKIMQELPGGGGGRDENPQVAAMRELKEETGYTSEEVTYLGKIYKDAYTNSCRHYFLAKNCEKTAEPELDDFEFIDVKLISIETLFNNARNSMMSDTEAVFLAYEQLIDLKEG